MEDILSSIRRILTEDEPTPSPPPAGETAPGDDVLVLDTAMMVPEPPPSPPSPVSQAPPAASAAPAAAPPHDPLLDTARVTPPTPTIAAAALHEVARSLAADQQSLPVRQGGPTIEDLVRQELRPLLKAWVDRHLEPMLERLVKAEVERVVGRAQR